LNHSFVEILAVKKASGHIVAFERSVKGVMKFCRGVQLTEVKLQDRPADASTLGILLAETTLRLSNPHLTGINRLTMA
jgi:hypothetical protein